MIKQSEAKRSRVISINERELAVRSAYVFTRRNLERSASGETSDMLTATPL